MVGSSLTGNLICILMANAAGFTLVLHVSGFASSLRPPEQATRSQKAFMAIARRMAALPRLPPDDAPYVAGNSHLHLSPSTQNLLQPQIPEEDREADEIQALNAELAELPAELRPSLSSETTATTQSIPLDQLRRMHANVETRLQPFWSSSVPNRPVKLSIFSAQEEDKDEIIQATSYIPLAQGRQPLFTVQTSTDAQGVFTEQIAIPYETIATHPDALSIAFGAYDSEPKVSNLRLSKFKFYLQLTSSYSLLFKLNSSLYLSLLTCSNNKNTLAPRRRSPRISRYQYLISKYALSATLTIQ
jgi:hypothetical protein